jgi:hypothetical protein
LRWRSEGLIIRCVSALIALLVDRLPARLWRPGNLHFIRSRALHFCLGGGGNRTIELDGREIASGRRNCIGEWPFDGTG